MSIFVKGHHVLYGGYIFEVLDQERESAVTPGVWRVLLRTGTACFRAPIACVTTIMN